MIRIGDLLSVNNGFIVHGCNAQGVMGSGVALVIRQKWPQVFIDYKLRLQELEKAGINPLGQIIVTEVSDTLAVISAITQQSYGRDKSVRYVSYSAMLAAFTGIASLAKSIGYDIHYPLIGAGLANGDWNIINKLIDQACEGVTHTLWIND